MSSQDSESSPPAASRAEQERSTGRRIVLFFDGTGNAAFLENVTNLPTLFSLVSADPKEQLLYYQAGIGTPIVQSTGFPTFLSRARAQIAAFLDEGIAYSLASHIQRGYSFLMNYWQPGDEIFLFGFSRGAFTARALAGMLQQVGLLPAGNEETVPLAYNVYKAKKDVADGLRKETAAQAFKRCFSRDVEVHFVGVWDTVSSVGGLFPRTLPFASGSSYIHHFRHAIALDERRAYFPYQPWIPADGPLPEDHSIKQVWFAGAHSNVGGGLFRYDCDVDPALSHITLRWMLREAVEVGLRLELMHVLASPIYRPFIEEAIRADADREDKDLEAFIARVQRRTPGTNRQIAALVYLGARRSPLAKDDALSARGDMLSYRIQKYPAEELKKRGVGRRLKDWWARQMQRLSTAGWWILEIVPRPQVVWDVQGKVRRRTWASNFGRGRILLPSPQFHFTVKDRLAASSATLLQHGGGNNENVPETKGYSIKARFLPGQSMKDVTFVE
ncbi:hypothetical protein JCM10908_005813 [Rhodotorula pacifica]|uniref:T6SS phospholipase effector Tle1-like catalytic domain-containing protein n=1 Tax=Rhodotorula pacifica TaxID=1495444 RepID=UPI003175F398